MQSMQKKCCRCRVAETFGKEVVSEDQLENAMTHWQGIKYNAWAPLGTNTHIDFFKVTPVWFKRDTSGSRLSIVTGPVSTWVGLLCGAGAVVLQWVYYSFFWAKNSSLL